MGVACHPVSSHVFVTAKSENIFFTYYSLASAAAEW